jgi:hypothetical protein
MNFVFIAYGCLMIGYAIVLIALVKRTPPRDGSTRWIVSHAALLGCSGLLILVASFVSRAEKAFVLCAILALVADGVVNWIGKRRLGIDKPNGAARHR